MLKTIIIILALAYIAFPRDLLPDWLVGFGWVDDIIVLYLLWRFFLRGAAAGNTGYTHQSRDRTGSADRSEPAPPKTPYEILEIEPDAAPEDIHKAYRRLAGKYHPDKTAHLGPEFQALAEEKFKEIQTAYEWLTRNSRT
jgi:uncharacterized membrane protein YkvA (DUF1232 family)